MEPAHGGAEVDVASEALDRREADEDREECEGRGGDEVDDVIVVSEPREPVDESVGACGVVRGHERRRGEEVGREDVVDRHHETAGDQGRKQRHEDVGDSLDEAGQWVTTLGRLLLGLVLGDLLDPSGVNHLGEDEVNVSRSDDDLEHAARDEGALEIGVLIESLLVDLVHVVEDKTQTGCAVRCCVDVVGATDVRQDVLRHAGVIHCHPGFLSRDGTARAGRAGKPIGRERR